MRDRLRVRPSADRLVVDKESTNAIQRELQVSHRKRIIIESVHNSIAGHARVERAYDRLVQLGHHDHWEYMRDYKYFIEHRSFCQMSMLKTTIQTTTFATAAYAPM